VAISTSFSLKKLFLRRETAQNPLGAAAGAEFAAEIALENAVGQLKKARTEG
jgi:hypothetical protein